MSRARGSRLAALAAGVVLASLVVVGGLARRVHAQDLKWTAEALPPEPDEKNKNPPPSVKVRIEGEPAPKIEKAEDLGQFVLKQVDAKPPMGGVKPYKIIPFHKSGESLAIVVLVEGHEYYFGNDKYKEQPKPNPDGSIDVVAITGGVYEVIKLALDAPGAENEDDVPSTISRAGPPGSKGALLVYGTGVDTRQPMGPLGDLTGDKLGEQERQKNNVTRDLMAGLRESLGQLTRVAANRKVLFVISDGVDPSATTDDFKALRKEFDNAKIEVFPMSLTSVSDYIGDSKNVIAQGLANLKSLGPAKQAKDGKELSNAIAGVVTNTINNRYWLFFPGVVVDPKTKIKTGLTWDEKEHELELKKGEDVVGEKNVTLLLAPKFGAKPGKSMWWLWLAIPGGLLAVVAAVLLLGKKKVEAPPPMVMAPPPPVAAAPSPLVPAPAASNKTMAINLSTGDGIPVVGWLVPVSGPQQFQTFKLLSGVTKIGNVQGAHIVFNDAFMSAEHAMILMTPNGFTLTDNNATNGTFVNEKRVQRHELVDNDMVMFGKTSCKFKTIVGLG
jgi:FHA domain